MKNLLLVMATVAACSFAGSAFACTTNCEFHSTGVAAAKKQMAKSKKQTPKTNTDQGKVS